MFLLQSQALPRDERSRPKMGPAAQAILSAESAAALSNCGHSVARDQTHKMPAARLCRPAPSAAKAEKTNDLLHPSQRPRHRPCIHQPQNPQQRARPQGSDRSVFFRCAKSIAPCAHPWSRVHECHRISIHRSNRLWLAAAPSASASLARRNAAALLANPAGINFLTGRIEEL